MKRLSKRKALMLISIGMFVMVFTQIFSHYTELPDLTKGLFTGVGMGLLLLALITVNSNSAHSKK
jgi:hypothetical protein